MATKEVIGERLRKLRGEQPRELVALGVGVTASALAMYETGKRIPRDEVKVRLAEFYHTTVQNIFFS